MDRDLFRLIFDIIGIIFLLIYIGSLNKRFGKKRKKNGETSRN